jgi:hypothetical protein
MLDFCAALLCLQRIDDDDDEEEVKFKVCKKLWHRIQVSLTTSEELSDNVVMHQKPHGPHLSILCSQGD